MGKGNKRPAAFKHGAYCRTDVLPGEDVAAFKKLHDDLVAELLPLGAIEENIVADLARLYWRKQNMATYRRAELARNRHAAISKELNMDRLSDNAFKTREDIEAEKAAIEEQAREELGAAWDLVEIGKFATLEYLLEELSVAERLDGMIDRALKRLLFVRGIKSYARTSSERPTPPLIKGPSRA